jgi:hypothetical protein
MTEEKEKKRKLNRFGDRDFWVDQYKNAQDQFDWYMQWGTLSEFVKQDLGDEEANKKKYILDVGCGTSSLFFCCLWPLSVVFKDWWSSFRTTNLKMFME